MKGEFVGVDGQRRMVDGITGLPNVWLSPTHPDFPAAVAALTELLPKPTVHPAVGLRYCGEEEQAPMWSAGGKRYRWNGNLQRAEVQCSDGGWEMGWNHPTEAFVASREYERRQW